MTWKTDVNVAALTVLTKEVRSLNPTFQAGDIRGMVQADNVELYVIVIWQASVLYWPFGPIQDSGCHITDLLDLDIGI